MDDQAVQTLEEEPAVELERMWLEQRRRAAEILGEQKAQLDEIDLRLAAQVELISSQLSAACGVSDEQMAEINRLRSELDERQLKIEQDHEKSALELQHWSDQLRQKQQELERRAEELQSASEKVKQDERALEAARHERDANEQQFAQRKAQLEEQQRRLDGERAAIEARQQEATNEQQRAADELDQQRAKQLAEIERKRAELDAAQQSSQQEAQRDNAAREQLALAQAEAERTRLALDEERRKLASERDELEELRRQGEEERRRLDRGLQDLKGKQEAADAAARGEAALHAELNRLRTECAGLTAQCAQLQAAAEKNTAQAAGQDQPRKEIQSLEQKLRAATENARVSQQQLSELRSAYDALQQEAADRAAPVADAAEIAAITAERDALAAHYDAASERIGQLEEELAQAQSQATATAERDKLAAQFAAAGEKIGQLEDELALAQSRAAATAADGAGDDQQMQDLQRRFELAVEDVRSLKRRNAELEDQVAGLKVGRSASIVSDGQDWESMKKRMMAELEADAEDTPERKRERISIENTIRATDELVSDRDREIEELKKLLNQQSDNIGSVAVGATAIEQMFDQDELIRQERERLQQAQQEWREKLRQAEIDVSLERARIARERVELEDKLRAMEAERAEHQAAAHGHAHGKGGKPARGRWLERLGLKDSDK